MRLDFHIALNLSKSGQHRCNVYYYHVIEIIGWMQGWAVREQRTLVCRSIAGADTGKGMGMGGLTDTDHISCRRSRELLDIPGSVGAGHPRISDLTTPIPQGEDISLRNP